MVTKKIFESLDMPVHLPLNSPVGLLHTDRLFLCNFMPDERFVQTNFRPFKQSWTDVWVLEKCWLENAARQ